MDEANTCETCRHWRHECRRNPPVIVEALVAQLISAEAECDIDEVIDLASWFPTTAADDYCGEWTRKQ